jgi:hypothetical protein
MKLFLRAALTLTSAVAAFYFAFWIGAALIIGSGLPFWLSGLGALLAALATGFYVWKRVVSPQTGLVGSVFLGVVVVGGLGFSAGFFGPMIFSSGAKQGSLIGFSVTGPIGLVLGALGGGVHWFTRKGRGLSGPL